MSDNRISHDWKAFPIFIVVLTLSLGCLCLPTSIIPTSAPTPTSTINATTINTPTVPPASVENETSRVREALNAEAPWLLIETDKGLWATNPDGSGLTQLADVDYWDANLEAAIQPGGNLIAFLTPANYDFHHMSLNLLSLPDAKIIKITDLTSLETETYADSAPGDISDALRAVRDQHNLALVTGWHTTCLCGIDGQDPQPISMSMTPTQERVQRLSQDDARNYWPSWSPDGDTLLYFGTQAFGTGAGFDTSGVWLAHGDNMDSSLLYKPGGGKEILDGWLDSTTALFSIPGPRFPVMNDCACSM